MDTMATMSVSKGYVKEVAGLGNTIKTLVSVMRYHPDGYAIDSPLLLHIFQGIPIVSDEDRKHHELYWGWQLMLRDTEKAGVEHLEYMMPVVGTTAAYRLTGIIDMQFERIPETHWQLFKPYFEKLLLDHVKPAVKDKVSDFSRDWNKAYNVVSMHVRTWLDEPIRHAMFHKSDFYINEVRKLPKYTKVFLATDSDSFAASMDKTFPGRIILYPRQHRGTHSYHTRRKMDYEEALVEMLLLAQNTTIIGSIHSTFTEVAYYFARCIHDVNINVVLE